MTNFFKDVFQGELMCGPEVEIAHSLVLKLRPRPMIVGVSGKTGNPDAGKKQGRGYFLRHASEDISRREKESPIQRHQDEAAQLFPAALIVIYNG